MSRLSRAAYALRDDPRWIPLPYFLLVLLLLLAMAGLYQHQRHGDKLEAKRSAKLAAVSAWARYDQQIDACERSNVLRQQIRDRDQSDAEIAIAFSEFLRQSVRFRLRNDQMDLAKQAASLRVIVDSALARQRPIQDVNCAKVITPPDVPRPQTQPEGE